MMGSAYEPDVPSGPGWTNHPFGRCSCQIYGLYDPARRTSQLLVTRCYGGSHPGALFESPQDDPAII